VEEQVAGRSLSRMAGSLAGWMWKSRKRAGETTMLLAGGGREKKKENAGGTRSS